MAEVASGETSASPWIELYDPSAGLPYYANPSTGETSWERPAGVTFPVNGTDWRTCIDAETQTTYWYNVGTKETAREPPTEFATSAPAPEVRPGPDSAPVADKRASIVHQIEKERASAADSMPELGSIAEAPLAKLDLGLDDLAEQFQFSDDDDDDDGLSGHGDDDAVPSLRHDLLPAKKDLKPYDSRAAIMAKQSMRGEAFLAQCVADASANPEPEPPEDLGIRLAVLSGNDWNGTTLYAVPHPTWPVPSPDACRTEMDLYPLRDYAEAHIDVAGLQKSVGGWFSRNKDGEMSPADLALSQIVHTGKVAKHPILRFVPDGPCAALAVRLSKNILTYCGERRSGKDWFGHVTRILASMLGQYGDLGPAQTEMLVSEVYVQVLRQIRGNGNARSLRLAWKLLLILGSIVSPGEEMYSYLSSFLHAQICDLVQAANKDDNDVLDTVVHCLASLDKTRRNGSRHRLPALAEVAAIQSLSTLEVNLCLLHGEQVKIGVHSQTTIGEIEDLCATFFEADAPLLAVHQMEIDAAAGTRVFRGLDRTDRVMDIMTASPDALLALRVPVITTAVVEDNTIKIGTRSLIFVELCSSLIYGWHRLSQDAQIASAALMLQGTLDCRRIQTAKLDGFIRAHVREITASRLRRELGEDMLIMKVAAALDAQGSIYRVGRARRCLIDELVHLATFGSSFFPAERQTTDHKGHTESSTVVLAISWRGLLLIEPESRAIMHGFTVPELLTYGRKDAQLIIVAGTSVRHDKLIFVSPMADAIDKHFRLCCPTAPAIVALGTTTSPTAAIRAARTSMAFQ
ncbi:WW domain-containing protein [Plasmodiophora brassicae]